MNGKDKALLEAGDIIVVEGRRRELLRVKDMPGLELKADVHLADEEQEGETPSSRAC